MHAAAANGDDVREGHLEQAFVAARGAEAAGLHAAKGHAGIGGRDDQVVDEDEAGLDACGERASLRRCRRRRWKRRARSLRRSRDARRRHRRGPLDEETRNVSGGEPCEQIVGDGLHNDEPARRDARVACRLVACRSGARARQDRDRRRRGRERRPGRRVPSRTECLSRERGEDLAAVFGGAGEDDFVHAVGDGVARGFNALGQDR